MPVIIAHRGASGYLPEHTLPAKAMAYAMGADFLEQDVVATRDDELVVLHDIHLDRVTDVAQRFPARARADGRYYVRDFDLAEIRALNVTERLDEAGRPVYPKRFPPGSSRFGVHTLAEELAFVRGLNDATGGTTGVYPEIKRPAVFVQCFDGEEVRRLRGELGCRMRLVQLIGDNSWGEAATDFDRLCSETGLADLAQAADAIGPWVNRLYTGGGGDKPRSTGLVERAHNAGLLVHPFTFRADDLAPGFDRFGEMVRYFCTDLGVDGLFTDFPDRVHQLLAV
jgi:glycerophosphoryl diester phosphodiesterase